MQTRFEDLAILTAHTCSQSEEPAAKKRRIETTTHLFQFLQLALKIKKLTNIRIIAGVAGRLKHQLAQHGDLKSAHFKHAYCITTKNDTIYVSEKAGRGVIRVLDLKQGTDKILAGTVSEFLPTNLLEPSGLLLDEAGNHLYVCEPAASKITKLCVESGEIVAEFGNGEISHVDGFSDQVRFVSPNDICCDSQGYLFVIDSCNHSIRKIDTQGYVTTLYQSTEYQYMQCITVNPKNESELFFSCENQIVKFDMNTSSTTLIAGSIEAGFRDGIGKHALFNLPRGLCFYNGHLLVADELNHRIRQIDVGAKYVTTIVGNGTRGSAEGELSTNCLTRPYSIAKQEQQLYVSDMFTIKLIE